MKNKILSSDSTLNVKDSNSILTEMDNISILTYKLTNDIKVMEDYFKIMTEYTVKSIGKNKINEYLSNDNFSNKNVKELKELLVNISKNLVQKIFLKISYFINERKQLYYTEFNDYNILILLIEKLLNGIEQIIEKLVISVLKISEIFNVNNDSNDLDFLCWEEISIMSSFEKFKFFVTILLEKIHLLGHIGSDMTGKIFPKISHCVDFFKKFNTLLYDLGEKYANSEIRYMKNKLIFLFKEESKNFPTYIKDNINSKYDELAPTTLSCIDDFFFILKSSGERAISSLNLQMSLAIINNIKSILSEELIELLELKISTILIKSDTKNSQFADIKYICRDEPVISYKYTYANLFLISCINSIDQTKSNIQLLMEELKNLVQNLILDSEIFNHKLQVLGANPQEEEKIDCNINYFKKNEIELVNITFSDIDMLTNKYEDFLTKKIKLGFEFLYPNIRSSVDLLNSSNYNIDSKNIINAELAESFANKFVDETEKILNQWKTQLSDSAFNKFLAIYCEYVSLYIEKHLMLKNYSTYGVIILEKDINKIINYFQTKVTVSIREKFNRVISIVKVLNFESREELIDYIRKYDDIKLTKNEIEAFRKKKE